MQKKQLPKFAIVPIHTVEENKLFLDLLHQFNSLTSTTSPDWDEIVSIWNPFADGTAIYYKTPQHLKAHHNIFKEKQIAANSKSIHNIIIENVKKAIKNNMPLSVVPPAIIIEAYSSSTRVLNSVITNNTIPHAQSNVVEVNNRSANLQSNYFTQQESVNTMLLNYNRFNQYITTPCISNTPNNFIQLSHPIPSNAHINISSTMNIDRSFKKQKRIRTCQVCQDKKHCPGRNYKKNC